MGSFGVKGVLHGIMEVTHGVVLGLLGSCMKSQTQSGVRGSWESHMISFRVKGVPHWVMRVTHGVIWG